MLADVAEVQRDELAERARQACAEKARRAYAANDQAALVKQIKSNPENWI